MIFFPSFINLYATCFFGVLGCQTDIFTIVLKILILRFVIIKLLKKIITDKMTLQRVEIRQCLISLQRVE